MRLDREICRRKSDGAFFRASCPDNYSELDALIDAIHSRYRWYFREVALEREHWWQLRPRWILTGEIWQPAAGEEFEVLADAAAREFAKTQALAAKLFDVIRQAVP